MWIQRLSSRHYLFWMSLAAVLWSLAIQHVCDQVVDAQSMSFETAGYVAMALNTAYAVLYSILTPPRLRDIGFPRWLATFSPLLLISVILAPLMLFYRGDPWDNKYGPAPEHPSLMFLVVGFLLFLMAVAMSYKAMVGYILMSQQFGA